MQLVLTEEQELLAKTARATSSRRRSPLARLRALRDANDRRRLLARALEARWPSSAGSASPFPEALRRRRARLRRARGRARGARPRRSCRSRSSRPCCSAASALAARRQRRRSSSSCCRRVVRGRARSSRSRSRRRAAATTCTTSRRAPRRAGDGWRLSGEKIQVLDGHVADALIVVARTAGGAGDATGITLFLVPTRRAGRRRSSASRASTAATPRSSGSTASSVGADARARRGRTTARALLDARPSTAPPSGSAPRCSAAWQQAFELTARAT